MKKISSFFEEMKLALYESENTYYSRISMYRLLEILNYSFVSMLSGSATFNWYVFDFFDIFQKYNFFISYTFLIMYVNFQGNLIFFTEK